MKKTITELKVPECLEALIMKKMNSKKISSKSTGTKEKNGDNHYTIPNEVCCSAEFPDGCISSDDA